MFFKDKIYAPSDSITRYTRVQAWEGDGGQKKKYVKEFLLTWYWKVLVTPCNITEGKV